MTYYQNIGMALEKDLVLNNVSKLSLEEWERSIDRSKMFGAPLIDLFKAFDCQNNDILIAKLNAHAFSLRALRLIHDYLSNRKERTRINNSYSTWMEIVLEVPQGSILGPLLLNILLGYLLFIVTSTDIAKYADDNTSHATANDIYSLIPSLEEASKSLFTWLDNNLVKKKMVINASCWLVLMKK